MIPTWIDRKAAPEFIAEVMRHMRTNHKGKTHSAKIDTLIVEMIGPQAFDDGRLLGLADRDDPVRLLGDQALAGIASG